MPLLGEALGVEGEIRGSVCWVAERGVFEGALDEDDSVGSARVERSGEPVGDSGICALGGGRPLMGEPE